MTNSNGLYRQTIYYPYSWGLHFARGSALDIAVEASSTYEVAGMGDVPHLDIAATIDSAGGTIAVFILNRDLKNARSAELAWEGGTPGKFESAWVLRGDDLKAVNGFDAPERVKPVAGAKPATSSTSTKIDVPPRSYSVYQWRLS